MSAPSSWSVVAHAKVFEVCWSVIWPLSLIVSASFAPHNVVFDDKAVITYSDPAGVRYTHFALSRSVSIATQETCDVCHWSRGLTRDNSDISIGNVDSRSNGLWNTHRWGEDTLSVHCGVQSLNHLWGGQLG